MKVSRRRFYPALQPHRIAPSRRALSDPFCYSAPDPETTARARDPERGQAASRPGRSSCGSLRTPRSTSRLQNARYSANRTACRTIPTPSSALRSSSIYLSEINGSQRSPKPWEYPRRAVPAVQSTPPQSRIPLNAATSRARRILTVLFPIRLSSVAVPTSSGQSPPGSHHARSPRSGSQPRLQTPQPQAHAPGCRTLPNIVRQVSESPLPRAEVQNEPGHAEPLLLQKTSKKLGPPKNDCQEQIALSRRTVMSVTSLGGYIYI